MARCSRGSPPTPETMKAPAGPRTVGSSDLKIVFQGRDEGHWDLFIMNPDGSMLQRLTAHSGNNESPSWAPNGRFIRSQDRLPGKRRRALGSLHHESRWLDAPEAHRPLRKQ